MNSIEILTLIIGVIALFPSASFARHVSDIAAAPRRRVKTCTYLKFDK
jgi:hypothetical protein